jgi:hypothetical protein
MIRDDFNCLTYQSTGSHDVPRIRENKALRLAHYEPQLNRVPSHENIFCHESRHCLAVKIFAFESKPGRNGG